MAETPSATGTKRPHSDSTYSGQPQKRRRVMRKIRIVQDKPQYVEPAPQDAVFVQGQLLRSISAALALVGFDSVKPTALEMFRACAEEYMLQFLHYIRTSMLNNRRSSPTAEDFASSLALMPNTSTASLLTPQLKLRVPAHISYPSIAEPDPLPAAAPDFSALLQPLITQGIPDYVPKHFPQLPPRHAWNHTPVYPEREKDARKMREKATEEGILAEQALRKLAAAAKTGAIKTEKRRLDVLSGPGRKVDPSNNTTNRLDRRRQRGEAGDSESMFADMMKQVGGQDADEDAVIDLGTDGANDLREEGMDVGMPEGVVVNWDMGGWRSGGRKGLKL